ncbi:MAG: chitobiase/beta-hexosaminidase C-terminal domain-containing protein, partial [Phycisphaerae bacterium]
TKDFGANEPGIASIQIYDAGGGDVAEFLLISNDGSPYQFAAMAIDPLNSTNYRIRTYNFTGYGNGYRDTTVARSTGAHTFKIAWPATGTVLFYIDDALVSTAYNGKTSGFDAVSLGHQSSQGTPPLNAHSFDNLNIVPPPAQGGTFEFSTFTMSMNDNTNSTVNMTSGTMNVGGYVWIGYWNAPNQTAIFNLNLGTNGEPNNGTLVNRADPPPPELPQAHKLGIGGGAVNAMDVFQGNGVVALSGLLELNGGRVIADGGAGSTTDKTLDMSTFAQILKHVHNPTDNGTSGFYARNRGKLILPPVVVASGSNQYVWGEDPEEGYNIDLTNSVLMSFNSVTTGDNVTGSLLAANRSDVGDTEAFNFIGVWNFSPGVLFNFGSGSVNLTFRYDDILAAGQGINQADLKVWHKVGATWVDVTTSVDTVNKLIIANGINSLSKFAVGVVVTQVATPNFDPSNPLIYNTLNPIVITCATPNVTIRYTDNGTEPTESNGTVIISGNSVNVIDGTTLKARAWKTGLTVSGIQSVTYTAPPLDNPQTIPQMSGVNVDGNLADWAGAEWIPLNVVYNGAPSDIAEAFFALKWDPATPSKVYFAVKVRDTAHFFTDNYTDWNARDAVELYLHTTGVSGDQSFAYSEAAQQLTIGIDNTTRNTVWSNLGNNMGIPTSGYDFQAEGRESGEWLYYEAAMTSYNYMGGFTSLPGVLAPLALGQIIGVDAVVTGHNGSAYTGQKSENTKTGKSANYNQFGLHKLVAGSPFVATTADLAAVLAAMDATATSGNWNGAADFDSDGEVTSSDLAFVLVNLP